MNLIKAVVVICIAMLVIGCGEKADKDTTKKQAEAVSAVTTEQNADPVGNAGKESPTETILTSIHTQWIISDSKPKVEITLFGENLAPNATITSNSPQITIEQVEADSFPIRVVVAMDITSPPGMYDLQYQAPGQAPIPFSIQYAGPK